MSRGRAKRRPAPAKRYRGFIGWLALAAALLLVAVFAYRVLVLPGRYLASLPDPDLADAEQLVAEKIRAARLAVEAEPRSAQAWGRLGISLDVHGFQSEGLVCYQQAAELDGEEFLWPYLTAIALRKTGSDEALAWLERSLELRDDHAPLHVRRGQALLEAGRLEEARVAFESALAADPKAAFALVGLARLSLMQDDPERSRAHAASALQAQPRLRSAHSLLAEAYGTLGEQEQMVRHRGIIADLPRDGLLPDPLVEARWASEGVSANWHDRRGTALSLRGEHARAVAEYRKAVDARPQAEYCNNLAAALFQTGRIEDAIEAARRALELDPSSTKAHANLATFYMRSERAGEALAMLQQGLERAPGDESLQWTLAWALVTAPDARLRDGPEAVRLLEGLLEARGRRDARTLGLLAGAYVVSGDLGRAIATDREALERARAAGRQDLAEQIETRLRRYGSALAPPVQ